MTLNINTLVFSSVLLMLIGCEGKVSQLGIENGRLKQCPETPNCVCSQASDEQHYIEPIHLTGTTPEVKATILKVLSDLKQAKIVKEENNYIRAEFVSRVFRFVDDVEFYFPDQPSKQMVIHVRSASRVGRSDFGVNRKRIENIREKLQK